MNYDRVIALGFFDGVHRGHGALLEKTRQLADDLGCLAATMTFDPHPDDLIYGIKTPLINTLPDRQRLMTRLYYMDEVLILRFNDEMMRMPWQVFVKDFLVGKFRAVHVVCGHDFTFGYKGLGNVKRLREMCQELGIGIDVIEPVDDQGGIISSTRIRELLKQGDLETANQLLGHCHFFSGTVVHGKKLGRLLGFPTANMRLPEGMLELACGVYATEIELPDRTRHIAVTNVGRRPTVDDGKNIMVESYLLDYKGDLYGRILKVEFCKYLRPEQKFDTVDDLIAAIHRDGEAAREFFAHCQKTYRTER